jgi:hypothetical protein
MCYLLMFGFGLLFATYVAKDVLGGELPVALVGSSLVSCFLYSFFNFEMSYNSESITNPVARTVCWGTSLFLQDSCRYTDSQQLLSDGRMPETLSASLTMQLA